MFSKKIFSLLALGMACAWQPASAQVSKVPFMVYVEAHIPAEQFTVTTVGWENGAPQRIPVDSETRRLGRINKKIRVRSNIGDVSARLDSSATLYNQTSKIPLIVSVEDKILTMQPQTVASHDDAKSQKGAEMNLSITAGDYSPAGLVVGDYSGTISMLFEASPATSN